MSNDLYSEILKILNDNESRCLDNKADKEALAKDLTEKLDSRIFQK